MSWINLFSKEEFAPYAQRMAQRDVVYWQQSILEEKLSELRAADRAKDWLKLSAELTQRQCDAVAHFEKQPSLASNHLNAIAQGYHEIDKQRLEHFSLLIREPKKHWFGWNDYEMMRMRVELPAEKKLLGRLSDLMDPEDAELRSGVYLYRLLDMVSIFAKKLCNDGDFDNPLAFLSEMSSIDSTSQAISLLNNISAYDRRDVVKWTNTYADKADLTFSTSIYGSDQQQRGLQQLVDLTMEIYESLNRTKTILTNTIQKSTGEDPFAFEELSSSEKNEFLGEIEKGFTRYNKTHLDRSVFLSTCFAANLHMLRR